MSAAQSNGAQRPATRGKAVSPARKYVLFGVFAVVSIVLDQWTKALARERAAPARALQPQGGDRRLLQAALLGESRRRVRDAAVDDGRPRRADVDGGRRVRAGDLLPAQDRAGATRLQVALGLVGGGAIGNLIDRVMYGRVTDFIVWHVKDHEWPAFNIADAALCIGVGLMVLDMLQPRPAAPSTS